jgi:PAS domain S-box-containing protein
VDVTTGDLADQDLSLSLLSDIGRVVDAGGGVETVAELILGSAARRLTAASARIFLIHPVTGDSIVVAATQAPGSAGTVEKPDPDDAVPAAPGSYPLPTDPEWREGEGEGAEHTLVVPIRAGAPTFGAIELRGRELRRPEGTFAEALRTACAMLAALVLREEAERRAAVAEAWLFPSEDPGTTITYIDALSGPNTTLYISPQVELLLGYSAQEWLDTQGLWESILHPGDRERTLSEDGRSFGDRVFMSEYRLLARDGTVRWFRDRAVVVEEDGRPMFWRGSMVEITEQKEAEIQLREAEERFRSLVEHLPAIVYVEEVGGHSMSYVSPQIEQITGFTPQERTENPNLWLDRLHPDDHDRFLAADAHSETTGEPFALEYRIFAKDGREVWLHDECTPIRGGDGEIRFWQGVALDVTELKRGEGERSRLLARLVKAQEEERARIAVDVHDDPIQKMTAVGLRLQALRRHVSGKEGEVALDRLAATVEESVRRMRGLLFELRPPALDEAGLSAALKESLEQARTDAGFRFEIEDELESDLSAETRTIAYRVAQEAISNVRKHAAADNVRLRISGEDGGILVRISDDGKGVDLGSLAPEVGHVGLRAMQERAELAGGWLRIESEPGAGTVVEFWLPA